MNTSIHIPDELAKKLANYLSSDRCKDSSKNAFIVEAIRQRLDSVGVEDNWSSEIMAWQGGEEELAREELTGFGTDLQL